MDKNTDEQSGKIMANTIATTVVRRLFSSAKSASVAKLGAFLLSTNLGCCVFAPLSIAFFGRSRCVVGFFVLWRKSSIPVLRLVCWFICSATAELVVKRYVSYVDPSFFLDWLIVF